jgi:hypothetical protein
MFCGRPAPCEGLKVECHLVLGERFRDPIRPRQDAQGYVGLGVLG